MTTKAITTLAFATSLIAAVALAQDTGKMQRMSPEMHHQLMPIHAKLMELQKTQDGEIDKLVSTMNSASGEQRIDAIIAVVNKLVEQRRTMHAEIATHLDK